MNPNRCNLMFQQLKNRKAWKKHITHAKSHHLIDNKWNHTEPTDRILSIIHEQKGSQKVVPTGDAAVNHRIAHHLLLSAQERRTTTVLRSPLVSTESVQVKRRVGRTAESHRVCNVHGLCARCEQPDSSASISSVPPELQRILKYSPLNIEWQHGRRSPSPLWWLNVPFPVFRNERPSLLEANIWLITGMDSGCNPACPSEILYKLTLTYKIW